MGALQGALRVLDMLRPSTVCVSLCMPEYCKQHNNPYESLLIFGRLARRPIGKYKGGAPCKAPHKDYCVIRIILLFPVFEERPIISPLDAATIHTVEQKGTLRKEGVQTDNGISLACG